MFSALKLLFSPKGWGTILRRGSKSLPKVFKGMRTSSRLMWRAIKRGYAKYPMAYTIGAGAIAGGIVAAAYNRIQGNAEVRVQELQDKLQVSEPDSIEPNYFNHARREFREAVDSIGGAFRMEDVRRKQILSLVKGYHSYLRSLPADMAEFALAADAHIGSAMDLGLQIDLHPTSDSIETAIVNIADDGQDMADPLLDFQRVLALDYRQLPFKTA